ncbi:MAG: AraC family transcriptional regulator [Planctomycetes bacterium]|nr:AraC family transcriptional regulator [Planctomycetota bacterium]
MESGNPPKSFPGSPRQPIPPPELARLGLTLPARHRAAGGHLRALVEDHDLRVLKCFCWRHRADWQMVLRSLPNGLLFAPLDQPILIEVGGVEAAVAPGQVAVMPAGVPQAARYLPGARRRVDLLAIHCEVRDRHGNDFLRRFDGHVRRPADGTAWLAQAQAATEAFNGGGEDGEAYAGAVLRVLLADLLLDGGPLRPPVAMDPRVARCIELAQGARKRAPSVEELARQVGLSVRRLRDLFHAGTGFQPKDWLLRDRLAEAARLLRRTALPVKAVAEAVGFASDHHFHTAFKHAHGRTPSAWREQSPRPVAGD